MKLLTDQELRQELQSYMHRYAVYVQGGGFDNRHTDELLDEAVGFVESQKLLHGDMVIGKDELADERKHTAMRDLPLHTCTSSA